MVELVLSFLIVWLALLIFGKEAVVAFSKSVGLDVVTLLSVAILGASVGMLGVIFQRLDSPFYKWLEKKGALSVYQNAFKYVAFVCLASIALAVFLKQIASSVFLSIGTLYVLILLAINAVTFLNNLTDLMRLEAKFRKEIG